MTVSSACRTNKRSWAAMSRPADILEVGFATADVTPDEDRRTIYHRRGMPLDDVTPICDRLYARATAFRCGDRQAVWVTCDLLCIDRLLRGAVEQRLREEGVSPDQFVLGATHTHTAPTVNPFHGIEPTPRAYLDALAETIAQTASEALRSAKPAALAVGKAKVDLGVNRRRIGRINAVNDLASAAGNVDADVSVLKCQPVDRTAGGLLFHYGAHPLAMWDGQPKISADYPGRAAAYLEREGGFAFAQFLQGCAGDVNVKIHGGPAAADRAGTMFGEAALEAAGRARPCAAADMSMTTQTVRLPWAATPTVDEADTVIVRGPGGGARGALPAGGWDSWLDDLRQAWRDGPPAPYAEVVVQALRVGEVVFVALPGEVFVEIGQQIMRQAGVERLFVTAYCDDCQIGYVPTAAAFDEGGYEVQTAPYYYGLFQLSPECERIIVAAALDAVRAVT